jgi:hypothetical protein
MSGNRHCRSRQTHPVMIEQGSAGLRPRPSITSADHYNTNSEVRPTAGEPNRIPPEKYKYPLA